MDSIFYARSHHTARRILLMESCPHPVEQLVIDHGDFTHRHAMFPVTLILRCVQCGLEWAPQTLSTRAGSLTCLLALRRRLV